MIGGEQRQRIRERYRFRCGYCGVEEIDAGGELTIDHFQPISQGGGDDDENLVYACSRCNTYKGAYWPGVADVSAGIHLLHPLRDDLTLHYDMDATSYRLTPKTSAGRHHVTTLLLNRNELIEHRRRKQREALQAIEREFLRSALEDEIILNRMQNKTLDYLLKNVAKARRRKRKPL